MLPAELSERLRGRFPDPLEARGEVTVFVSPDGLLEALAWLRDEEELSFDSAADVTATDWPDEDPRFWVAYHLRSMRHGHRIRVKVGLTGDSPRVPSITPMFPTANWLEGEYVVSCRPVLGYLHTGIEKNTEYRTWQQGVTFVTRADYLSPFFNELGYCLAVERLLGIEAPPRAQVVRVLVCELNRIASHLVWLATTGLELGAISIMLYGFREREEILRIFEMVTGLRMNHAYIRVGGLSMDLPEDAEERVRDFLKLMPGRIHEYEELLSGNPIWQQRTVGIGYVSPDDLLALGVTGPMLRAVGIDWDLRKATPYCGYETFDFDVPTSPDGDCFARYQVRVAEMRQS